MGGPNPFSQPGTKVIYNIFDYVILFPFMVIPGFQLLRDTFAGKNLREICRRETDSEKWSEFYRQKCRADIPVSLV